MERLSISTLLTTLVSVSPNHFCRTPRIYNPRLDEAVVVNQPQMTCTCFNATAMLAGTTNSSSSSSRRRLTESDWESEESGIGRRLSVSEPDVDEGHRGSATGSDGRQASG